ncbi:MAG: hypothetical protein BWY14_01017 [Parcubacteria group bacterium ADurb.Bin192]|nr:MAG: hypothetical protein BWY14_01017 [Parcubacteria group bacterium ADurb.Bin192]
MPKPTPENIEKVAIKEYLDIIGAFHYPNSAGLRSYHGIPDRTAIIDGKVYQIEVKAGSGKQSEAQKRFQRAWEEKGGKYILGGIDDVIEAINKPLG